MFSQSIVQWNYIIYFHIRGSFFNNFLHHFWKRVNNSKGIVNLQGLLMLIVVYVDMNTYPLTKYYYIIERVYFIYQLFILFIIIFSFLLFLFTESWRYKRDYLHTNIDILIYILLHIMNTTKKH